MAFRRDEVAGGSTEIMDEMRLLNPIKMTIRQKPTDFYGVFSSNQAG
jgi:hypothetical protein